MAAAFCEHLVQSSDYSYNSRFFYNEDYLSTRINTKQHHNKCYFNAWRKKLAACLALDSVLSLTTASPPPGWSLPFCFTAEMGELKVKSVVQHRQLYGRYELHHFIWVPLQVPHVVVFVSVNTLTLTISTVLSMEMRNL